MSLRELLRSGPAGGRGEAGHRATPPTDVELKAADAKLKLLLQLTLPVGEGERILCKLAQRPAPSVTALRSSKAGVTIRRLRGHRHSSISSLTGGVGE